MYEKLSEDIIKLHQQKETPLTEEELCLKDILTYYEKEIMPFKYTYECEYGLHISFCFNKDNLCHLLFGTIDKKKHPSWKKKYSGNKGYEGIDTKSITLENLPDELKSKAINRAGSFILINKLLKKPSIIHFNCALVKNSNIKTINTNIDAKYLLNKKTIEGTTLHLFLKETDAKHSILVPNSFFPNSKDNYIENQLPIKVISSNKERIINKQSNTKAI